MYFFLGKGFTQDIFANYLYGSYMYHIITHRCLLIRLCWFVLNDCRCSLINHYKSAIYSLLLWINLQIFFFILFDINNTQQITYLILYTGLFSPSVISSFFACKRFRPCLESVHTKLCWKIYILRHWNVLISPADNESNRGKIRRGECFPV